MPEEHRQKKSSPAKQEVEKKPSESPVGDADNCCGAGLKGLFPGYFQPTDAEIAEVWKNGIFVFDASALLDVYRFSPPSAREYTAILERLSDRVWLPYFAAQEFVENRLAVLRDQETTYAQTIERLQAVLDVLEAPRAHPFISDDALESAKAAFKQLFKDLEVRRAEYAQLRRDDPHQSQLVRLFEGRTGSRPSDTELAEWSKEAQARLDQEQPPGFRDVKKKPPRSYHDYFIWTEIVELSKRQHRTAIFVTSDEKEDWWRKWQGEKLGPHPLLVQEMAAQAGRPFFMYTPDRFLERARDQLNERVSSKVIEEARATGAAPRPQSGRVKVRRRPVIAPLIQPSSPSEEKTWVSLIANSKKLPRLLRQLANLTKKYPFDDMASWGNLAKRAEETKKVLNRELMQWPTRYCKAAGWLLWLSPTDRMKMELKHLGMGIPYLDKWNSTTFLGRQALREYLRERLQAQ